MIGYWTSWEALVREQDAWEVQPVFPGQTIESEFPAEKQVQANAMLILVLCQRHCVCHSVLVPGSSQDRPLSNRLVGMQFQPSQTAPAATHLHLSS